MGIPLTTSELLTAILTALGGMVAAPVVDPIDPAPSTSPTGMATAENWRSRPIAAQFAQGRNFWTVPLGREWQIQGISGTLATSATIGTRFVEAVYNPEDPILNATPQHRFPAGASQAANLTYTYNFAMGQPLYTAVSNNYLGAPLPPAILRFGSLIILYDRAQVDPAVAADVWSNVNLLVLERVIT